MESNTEVKTSLWQSIDYCKDDKQGWEQITCAMETENGCIIKVIHKTKTTNGWTSSVSICFVPACDIVSFLAF